MSSPATPRTKVVLRSRQLSQLPAPQIAPRTKVVLARHNLRRGLRAHRTNRTLACVSRTRHARSPQRVARAPNKSHSRLHLAHSTRTISAEGYARTAQIALSPAFRALDARDLRRRLRAPDESHSRLHFAHWTRTISAEGCARTGRAALSPAFGALDTHDLRRGLRAHRTSGTLACISRTRHARSPQRVARAGCKSHSRLHFAHSTRTISAEGSARTGRAALSPAFGALDTHDLRRGFHFRLMLFVPPSACKREFLKRGNVFIRTSPVLTLAYSLHALPTHAYSLHACILIACILIACLRTHHCTCIITLTYLHTYILTYLHLHTLTLAYFALGCFRSSTYTGVRIPFML